MRFRNLAGGVLIALAASACGGDGNGDNFGPVLPGRLVYVDVVAGQDQLWVSRADGSESRQVVIGSIAVLPPHEAGISNLQPDQITSIGLPIWSPDGSKIAVAVSRSENQSQIVVVDAETGAAFTASPQLGKIAESGFTADDHNRIKFMDWSPDGRHIAYLAEDTVPSDQRLMVTRITDGDVQELMAEFSDLQLISHRFDDISQGLYVGVSGPDRADVVYLDLDTRSQITTRSGFGGVDLSRSADTVFSTFDFEYTALGFLPRDSDSGTPIIADGGPSRGEFFGWFLSSPMLVAVEEVWQGVRRDPPLIARFDPSSPVNGDRFDHFSVAAPIPFKWDFLSDP